MTLNDPNPVVRKAIASRTLTKFGQDPAVQPAITQMAADDDHPGVRWAGRYALRVLDNQSG